MKASIAEVLKTIDTSFDSKGIPVDHEITFYKADGSIRRGVFRKITRQGAGPSTPGSAFKYNLRDGYNLLMEEKGGARKTIFIATILEFNGKKVWH